ncbi:TonB-dependent receptor [Terriglobus albidus]|uniref:TonB-dependent receptor n=1 Tax=Terriglobus albidus TaxID=1592106 RepID=UPI0021E05A85|nr:carboxypeptidase regulatory-like domain-containing protein [Terriglobus albidus]
MSILFHQVQRLMAGAAAKVQAMLNPSLAIAWIAILLCFGSNMAIAQTSSATLSGHVVDESNAVVVNAEVILTDEQTGVSVSTRVRTNGDFIFPDIQPGTFSVTIQYPGYKVLRKVDLRLSANQNLSAGTLILQVGGTSESVTVSADITPIQTSSSERSDVLDSHQISNLLAIGRDTMAMLRIMPGVVGGGGATSLGTATTPTINGVNSEYNSATVDGVTGNTRGNNSLDTPLNLDAVNEVTVMAANYQAQYGKTAGANISIVTKSGTSQFHGALYYYFRNEDLNANSYFNKFNGQARPRYRYNTYGGTLGGPIFWPGHLNSAKNKLFFFVSLENSPITSPDGLKYYYVPTPLEISGDFSQSYAQGNVNQVLKNIKMPGQTTASCPASGAPGPGCYPGNKIPVSQLNAQGQALLKIFYNNTIGANPGFAFNNRAISAGNYNYITNYSASAPVNQEIFRIDYFPTEKLHVFGRGDLETVNNSGHSSPAAPAPWLLPINYRTANPNFVINTICTFSPSLVNEINLGTAGWSEHQLYNDADLAKAQLDPNGYNIAALYPGVNPRNLLPSVSFGLTNSPALSWDYRFPMADQVRSFSATDNLTKILGSHTVKIGVDAQTDSYLQVANNRVGNFSYASNTSNINDSNYAYSNAVLGNFNTMTEVTKLANFKPRTITFEWYTQDTWKVTSKLVLDYGVRYSWAMAQRLAAGNNFVPSLYTPGQAPLLYQPTSHKDSNGLAQAQDPRTGAYVPAAYGGLFVPGTGNLNNGILYVNTPGYPQGTLYGNGILFAPRVGFAYDPHGAGKTVIRGGYGIFYNVRARAGQSGDMALNSPTANSPTQYYGNLSNFQSAGGLSGPFTIGHVIPLHAPQVSTMNMSLGIQQALRTGAVLDVAYVGTLGRHLSNYTPINEVPYGAEFQYVNQSAAGGTLSDNFFRPYPGFGTINMQNFNLTSNYNSLQTRVSRRFAKGLEFGVSYTWSKSMDYTDTYNGTIALYQPLRSWNYGPAGWDIRHNLVANYLWSLPHVSGLWRNFATKALLDNWQISGIASHLSGAPGSFTFTTSNSANITGGGDGARLILTGDPMQGAPRTFNQWFNTSVVQVPMAGIIGTATKPAVLGQTGNAPKVNYYLPGVTNFDTALFKNIPVEGRLVVQFRLETYNTFNHAEFNGVNSAATFATAASASNPNPAQTNTNFGRLSSTLNPRYLQLALRINY